MSPASAACARLGLFSACHLKAIRPVAPSRPEMSPMLDKTDINIHYLFLTCGCERSKDQLVSSRPNPTHHPHSAI
jgi:hypothetical protein